MIKACLLLLAGGFAAQHSRVLQESDPGTMLLVASVVLLALPRARTVGCLLLGFAIFLQAGQRIIEQRLDPRFAGDSMLTRVRVVDFPRVTGKSVVMRVTPLGDPRLPPLSRVSWYEPPVKPVVGDVWQLELRLRRPRGASNPGVFDFEAWLFRERIHATGYVVDGTRNRLVASGRGGAIDKLRLGYLRHASAAADSAEGAAVLAAVGVGARHLVSREQWRRYALSGTSHLMAISGLHVGLAASSVIVLAAAVLGLLRLKANTYIAAIVVGVLAGSAYALVSGLGVPAQRASLMLIIAAFVVLRRRQLDPMRTLAVAAVIVYVHDPVATMSPGFSLSFAAVATLFWLAVRRPFTPTSTHALGRHVTAARRLAGVQLFLLFGLMPLTVLFFQRVTFLGLPANLFAVPVFTFVTVPLALAGLALAGVSEPLTELLLGIAAASIEWLEAGIRQLVRLPFADLAVAPPRRMLLPTVFLPALFVLLPRGWPGRALALLGVVALLSHVPRPPAAGCFEAHVLDVGQGLAVVVRTRHHALLFDTGVAYRGGGSAAEQVILPFLRARGLRRLDWLLVSHADLDHSGGLRAITENADIDVLLVGERSVVDGVPSRSCLSGQSWSADGVDFRMLHPSAGAAYSGNDASCVLLIDTGGRRLLLTGDIEARAEHDLLRRDAIGSVDVVVVPHHGSLTSSSLPFVARLAPQVAVVSAAHANRWGFPREAVVRRWRDGGATVMNTADDGAVSLEVCREGGLRELRRDRHERRRFWRQISG